MFSVLPPSRVPSRQPRRRSSATRGTRVVVEFTTAGRVDARIAPVASARTSSSIRARASMRWRRKAAGRARCGISARCASASPCARVWPSPTFPRSKAFRAALVAARSVAYTDPAAGGTAGSHFAAVIEKLGLTEELAGKRHLALDGLDVMRKVRSGEVDLGITQVSEILLRRPRDIRGAASRSRAGADDLLGVRARDRGSRRSRIRRGAHQRRRARAIRRRRIRVTR